MERRSTPRHHPPGINELQRCLVVAAALRRHNERIPPIRGLQYPKTTEKPKFQTWVEIERQILRGRLTPVEQTELWSCLYLTTTDIEEVLDFVAARCSVDWMYPMLLMAAHTGARRSEILRSEVNDVDFENGTLQIREKKRAKGKSTTRVVPMSARLRRVLESWLTNATGR